MHAPANPLPDDDEPRIAWSSDRSLLITLADAIGPRPTRLVRAVHEAVTLARGREILSSVIDAVPACTSITLVLQAPPTSTHAARELESAARDLVLHALQGVDNRSDDLARIVEIPFCADDGDMAPDLRDVAGLHDLSPAELLHLFTAATFDVQFLGFSPGFAYLAGLPEKLHTPRRASPRPRVPAGSVAIAGAQAGVYPHATPGGWHILGRTPLKMFDPARTSQNAGPALLRAGDRVRFVVISRDRFGQMQHDLEAAATPPPPQHCSANSRPLFRVIEPGMQTTIQDAGRPGHASLGVSASGAADPRALRVANSLVGNRWDAPALECTLQGPTLELLGDATLAVAGAGAMLQHIDPRGTSTSLPMHETLRLRTGDRLRVGPIGGVPPPALPGVRCMLAVHGGFDVPRVLGSASTHLGSALGGLAGRALRAGDVLHAPMDTSPIELAGTPMAQARSQGPIRIMRGVDATMLGPDALADFLAMRWIVSDRSDRTGVRLQADVESARCSEPGAAPSAHGSMISRATLAGMIQLPSTHEAIILGPDAPATGGYPVIASVVTDDLPQIGQLRPRSRVHFVLTRGPGA